MGISYHWSSGTTAVLTVHVMPRFPHLQVRNKLGDGWRHYKGQAQRWYLVHFYGENSEISIDTEHKEFKAWQWMELEKLPESVVEFKQGVYEQVADQFVPLIKDLKERGELTKIPQHDS